MYPKGPDKINRKTTPVIWVDITSKSKNNLLMNQPLQCLAFLKISHWISIVFKTNFWRIKQKQATEQPKTGIELKFDPFRYVLFISNCRNV